MNFNIVDFYPSISEGLLRRALSFARNRITITNDEMDVIFHSRKSLLFGKDRVRMKKDDSGLFDVAMGSYEGAEVCKLVGIFALNQLPKVYRKEDRRRIGGLQRNVRRYGRTPRSI